MWSFRTEGLVLALGLLEICQACLVYCVTGPAGMCSKKLIYTPAQADKKTFTFIANIDWLKGMASAMVCVTKSKPASQKHHRLFVDICSQSQECKASKCWQSVFGLAADVPNAVILILQNLGGQS